MPHTLVYYYISPDGKNVVREFIISLQPRQQAKIRRLFQTITEYGISSIIPHIKKLTGTHLWEIRILGNDNIRILYAAITRDYIVVLHGFLKKTRKTPPQEMLIASKRWLEWQTSYCK